MAGFIFKLQTIVSAPPQTTNTDVQIANLLLENVDKIDKEMTISQMAEMCYTSISSISRFANNLGYENFNHMKNDYFGILDEFTDLKVDNSFFRRESFNGVKEKIIQGIASIEHHEIKSDAEFLSKEIMSHDSVTIIATHIPNNIMSILHRALIAQGKYINFVVDRHQQIIATQSAKKGDLFIVVSLEGTLTMERDITLPLLTSDAKKIIVTQNENIKFAAEFDRVISIGEASGDFVGKYKLMFFVDYLIHYFYYKANI